MSNIIRKNRRAINYHMGNYHELKRKKEEKDMKYTYKDNSYNDTSIMLKDLSPGDDYYVGHDHIICDKVIEQLDGKTKVLHLNFPENMGYITPGCKPYSEMILDNTEIVFIDKKENKK